MADQVNDTKTKTSFIMYKPYKNDQPYTNPFPLPIPSTSPSFLSTSIIIIDNITLILIVMKSEGAGPYKKLCPSSEGAEMAEGGIILQGGKSKEHSQAFLGERPFCYQHRVCLWILQRPSCNGESSQTKD